MTTTDKLGETLHALSNPYRRQLLLALRSHNPQHASDPDPLNVVDGPAEQVDVRQLQLEHVHLPKLAAMGFIEWHQETDAITRGPRWDEIRPLVRLISDHRDELPETCL